MCSLYVSQVARVLNRDRQVERGDIRKAVEMLSEKFLCDEDLVRRMLLEVGTTSRRIHDDWNVEVECSVDAFGEPLAICR